jgi:Flp pilus assembly protein TadG
MSSPHRDPESRGPAGSTAVGPSTPSMRTSLGRLRRVGRRRHGERGQAVLEFALVLPLLAALILIFVSFGKALYYYIELTHVANEGAREAAVNLPNGSTPLPGGDTSLTTYLCQQFGSGSELYKGSGTVTPAAVKISYPDTGSATPRAVGEPVRVDVSTSYSWFPIMNLGTFTIDASATMRLEQDTSQNTSLDPSTTACS